MQKNKIKAKEDKKSILLLPLFNIVDILLFFVFGFLFAIEILRHF